jgi:hypothetical protein|nr:MAG TPA: Envelope protein [Caudoviricetes sp.]
MKFLDQMPTTKKAFRYLAKLITIEYIGCYILGILTMVLCMLTNPIVVLFCDKYGNLPRIFRLWQTYDNCLDIDWMIYENKVPKIFQYDFNKHYKYYMESKNNDEMIPGHVVILDDNFTIKERIQRYFCRVLWLYRNCAYGFAYNLLGIEFIGKQQYVLENSRGNGKELFVSYLQNPKGLKRYFSVKCKEIWVCPIIDKKFRMDIYMGWKLSGTQNYTNKKRAMLAIRISPFIRVK